MLAAVFAREVLPLAGVPNGATSVMQPALAGRNSKGVGVATGWIISRALRSANFLRFYFAVGVFCAGSLGWSLVAALLHRVLPRGAGAGLGQSVMSFGFRCGLWLMRALRLARFRLRELDALGAQGPMVIVCNHLTLLDAVMVVSRLPRAVCIAKADLWNNPALGGSVRLAGYVRNDAPLALVRAGVAALRRGTQVVVFPEGTRSDGSGIGPFKGGFALMARAAGVPIQTVLLDNDTSYLGRGWKLHRMPPFPMNYRARVGRRFVPGGDLGTCVATIEDYFARALADA